MTDKHISQEKLVFVLRSLGDAVDAHPSKKFRQGGNRVLKSVLDAINCGSLDAGRPECPKCNDTGERPTKTELVFEGERHRMTVPCDCGAKGGT